MDKKCKKEVDLFMFMGQSNMAGRGVRNAEHPEPPDEIAGGAGYEYRAVSAPGRLFPVCEPFGRNENRSGGIDDGDMKTGSMVTSFINAYYDAAGVPVAGVSASKGGSRICQWQPGGAYLTDAVERLKNAVSFLEGNGYIIRHKYMLWCQGESDGDVKTTQSDYCVMFENMLSKMLENGIEKCFMVRIGEYNGPENYNYREIRNAQDKIARENENVIMVSTAFVTMKERGLMKDSFHYFQQAYNEVGAEAGAGTAAYVNKFTSAAR